MVMSRTVLVCGVITLGLLACNGLVGLDGLRTNDTDASSGGSSGTSGTSGTSGSAGTSGASGASGTSGTSGTSGSTGTSGTSGASSSGADALADTAVDTNPPPPVDAGGTCVTATSTAGHNLTIIIGNATRATGIQNKGTTGFSISGTNKTVVECLPIGDLVDLRADPDSSPYANSWTGDCASSDTRKCTLTLNKDSTVSVTLQ
jgi:hypothetical protein